jgi:hypothetical protein
VKTTSDRQKRFDAAMAELSGLPQEQQVDALLHFLTTVLHEMPTDTIRQRRNELMERFANCGCSYETCAALLELVDYQLTRREKFAARQEAEARRAAKAALRGSVGTPFSSAIVSRQPGSSVVNRSRSR